MKYIRKMYESFDIPSEIVDNFQELEDDGDVEIRFEIKYRQFRDQDINRTIFKVSIFPIKNTIKMDIVKKAIGLIGRLVEYKCDSIFVTKKYISEWNITSGQTVLNLGTEVLQINYEDINTSELNHSYRIDLNLYHQ